MTAVLFETVAKVCTGSLAGGGTGGLADCSDGARNGGKGTSGGGSLEFRAFCKFVYGKNAPSQRTVTMDGGWGASRERES